MTSLDTALIDAFDEYLALARTHEPTLTALDERSGDGDFGTNLTGGLERAAVDSAARSGRDCWGRLARVFLDDVGGTSGPLFGLLFDRIHAAAESAGSLDDVLRVGVREGLDAIQRVGEAEVGDRTIVDALAPAAASLDSGDGVAQAARAAAEGASSTAALIARRGRASYVGERAVGSPDPGAVGIALMFIAFSRAAGDPAAESLREVTELSLPEEDAEPSRDDDVDGVLAQADAARRPLARMPLAERAVLLETLADMLETETDALVGVAQEETYLADARLRGEVSRTAFQLRLFASMVKEGSFRDVRIDHADSEWQNGAGRPDLRRSLRPIGPVLVFAASNFPFAFSVLGGDTASALAAGNPVVVKAHPGHPRLSRLTAELAGAALREAGAPDGTFALIEGTEASLQALRDPRVKAAAFTGSITGGRALFDIAQSRPEPIPFFGELGSTNPAFVTRGANAASADEIAAGFIQSFTGSAGQLCTKPGVLVVPRGSRIAEKLRGEALPAAMPMLNSRIRDGYLAGMRALVDAAGAEVLRCDGDSFGDDPAATLVRVDADAVLADPPHYLDERFGPAALVVEYDTDEQLLALAEAHPGQLTATIFATPECEVDELVDVLTDRAGRVLWGQWPTGVSVTDAQQHGGPYPSSTASQTTSVGTAAIERFLRPVAYQNFPSVRLPEEMRD